ncbi:Gfo/Idh/MocA family oxidoreductase [uncultured Lamprocystis sp.]|jgi:predicted dehydrogenase|uniref:Gfo/Idh/MocA family protein n=1 Tax=uncultured Lamprocystis sp. TaxID=543132 RepID=UPI0025F21FDD|nr:Gfo/Idh/MocA family oxidoreductase [uncultured Lamprocystis sp.]
MTIKVAFIGCGYMASEHAKAFRDIGCELAGVFSRTFARAEAFAAQYSIPTVCESISELHEKTQADVVIIAVPELSVSAVSIAAFEHPWLCLIEKPAGYNIADAEKISRAAHTLQRRAFVALNRRHYSSTRAVATDLRNRPGRRLVHVVDQESPRVALESGQPRLVVDNWMYANSLHVIDYFSVFCRGDLLDVVARGEWRSCEPSFVVATLTFSSGDIGSYEGIWEGPGPWAVTVTTPERRWELRPLEQASFQDYGSRKNEPLAVDESDKRFKPGLYAQALEVLRAARGEHHALPSVNDGLASMRMVERIYGR